MSKQFILFLLLLQTGSLSAQDANYWFNAFSAGGFVTDGAVIADNKDSGVFFFNPALLALSRKNTASVSGTVYEYQRNQISNALGKGNPMGSTWTGAIPQMASATLYFNSKKPFTIGYALLHSTSTQRDRDQDVLAGIDHPGKESFLRLGGLTGNINELTGIVAGGMALSKKVSIGISSEFQLRRQQFYQELVATVFDNAQRVVEVSTEQSYFASFDHMGLKFKAGISYNEGGHHFGLLISSPLLSVKGSGHIQVYDEINHLVND